MLAQIWNVVWDFIFFYASHYPWWFLAPAIVLIILRIAAGVGPRALRARLRGKTLDIGAAVGVVSGVLGIIGFAYAPVRFVLVPTATDLLLNSQSDIRLLVRQKDTTESAPASFQCSFVASPTAPVEDWNAQPGCKLSVTDSPAFFASGRQSPLVVTLSTNPARYSWEGPDPITLTLFNIGQPNISVPQPEVQLGQTEPASVRFENGPAPAVGSYNCFWSPPQYFSPSEGCETHLIAPRGGSALSDPTIDAGATVVYDGKRFEAKSLKIGIAVPPANLLQIVLDTSGPMADPLPNGQAFFEVARSSLKEDLQAYAEQGGWLSIIGYGRGAAPDAATCDQAVRAVYPLSSINASDAEKSLDALNVAGLESPLATAIEKAADEYQRRPPYLDKSAQSSYVFALISAQGTSCDHLSLAAAIQRIGAAFDRRGLGNHLRSVGSLSFVIVKDSKDVELTYHDKSYGEQRTILLIVRDQKELNEIVRALGGLFDIRPQVRKASCQQLIAPLERLEDKYHADMIRRSRPCVGT